MSRWTDADKENDTLPPDPYADPGEGDVDPLDIEPGPAAGLFDPPPRAPAILDDTHVAYRKAERLHGRLSALLADPDQARVWRLWAARWEVASGYGLDPGTLLRELKNPPMSELGEQAARMARLTDAPSLLRGFLATADMERPTPADLLALFRRAAPEAWGYSPRPPEIVGPPGPDRPPAWLGDPLDLFDRLGELAAALDGASGGDIPSAVDCLHRVVCPPFREAGPLAPRLLAPVVGARVADLAPGSFLLAIGAARTWTPVDAALSGSRDQVHRRMAPLAAATAEVATALAEDLARFRERAESHARAYRASSSMDRVLAFLHDQPVFTTDDLVRATGLTRKGAWAAEKRLLGGRLIQGHRTAASHVLYEAPALLALGTGRLARDLPPLAAPRGERRRKTRSQG